MEKRIIESICVSETLQQSQRFSNLCKQNTSADRQPTQDISCPNFSVPYNYRVPPEGSVGPLLAPHYPTVTHAHNVGRHVGNSPIPELMEEYSCSRFHPLQAYRGAVQDFGLVR